ncbi:MAG: alanine racemase [bacterium]|nr:alanine racemase [bacterium]
MLFSTHLDNKDFIALPFEPLPGIQRRPTYAEISFAALKNNLQIIRSFCPQLPIMASVKAQAYGHGLLKVAKFLSEQGVQWFGVGFLEEGIWLRKGGIDNPILAMGGIATNQISHYLDYQITLTCSSWKTAQDISAIATQNGKKAKVHIKIDTGMRRIGVWHENAIDFVVKVAKLPGIEIEGIFSHLAQSEIPNDPFTKRQIEAFADVLTQLKKNGLEIPIQHLANSAAIVNYPESHFQLVRPGLILYGYTPTPKPDERLKGLQLVMSFKSEILFVKGVRKGEGISYGLTYRPSYDVWIATVPVGYGDGYNRLLSNRASVLIHGKRYTVCGKICMDQMMVNTMKDRYEPGTEVVLFGKQKLPDGTEVQLNGWELCNLLHTIPYELTCWVSERVPRIYIYE